MFYEVLYIFVYVGKSGEGKTFNQLVERSNRSRPTIFIKGLAHAKPFWFLALCQFCAVT